MKLAEIIERLLPGATHVSRPLAVPSRADDLAWHRRYAATMRTRMDALSHIAAVMLRDEHPRPIPPNGAEHV